MQSSSTCSRRQFASLLTGTMVVVGVDSEEEVDTLTTKIELPTTAQESVRERTFCAQSTFDQPLIGNLEIVGEPH